MLVHNYELFKIKSEESITQMFTHFTDIINSLKILGKYYSNSDLMRKVLRSLPRSWKVKVTAIQEAKDLNTLPLEELLGSLMTHELIMKQYFEEKIRRKETIALKSTAQDEEDSEKSENSEEDEDLALITKKFRWFIRKGRQRTRRRPLAKGEPSKEKEKKQSIICYECKKSGHFRSDYLQLKKGQKKFKKKKTMMAMWSDSDDFTSDEESHEEANLCLMAYENEVTPKTQNEFSYDEL